MPLINPKCEQIYVHNFLLYCCTNANKNRSVEQACKIFPGLLYQIWLSCPHCQDVGIMLSFTVLSLLLPLLPPLSFRKEMFCIIFISTKIIWWDLRRACITHFQVLSWATGLQFLLVEKVDGWIYSFTWKCLKLQQPFFFFLLNNKDLYFCTFTARPCIFPLASPPTSFFSFLPFQRHTHTQMLFGPKWTHVGMEPTKISQTR